LARTSNLTVHGQPLVVAYRPRSGELRTERAGQVLNQRYVILALDTAADRDYSLGLSEINRLFGFLEFLERLRTYRHAGQIDFERLYGRWLGAALCAVCMIRSSLKRR